MILSPNCFGQKWLDKNEELGVFCIFELVMAIAPFSITAEADTAAESTSTLFYYTDVCEKRSYPGDEICGYDRCGEGNKPPRGRSIKISSKRCSLIRYRNDG